MAPAEQPPNRKRSPAPSPRFVTRSVTMAANMREPRKFQPNVASLAAASPDHKSDEQYAPYTCAASFERLRQLDKERYRARTRFAFPHALDPSTATWERT